MDTLILFCLLLFWIFIAIGLRHWYRYSKERNALLEHVKQTIEHRQAISPKNESLFAKIVKRSLEYADEFSAIGQRVNFFSEAHDIDDLLRKAGHPLDLTVERFQGLKMFTAFVGFVAGVIFFILGFPLSLYGMILLPVAGFLTPILLLKNKAKARQEQLRYDLPDFLDTVSISLQAGIGLDQALREVIGFFDGPIHEEFSRFNQEIELGVQRERAYRNLLNRNDNPEFQSLIKSLLQGMKLGVPISTTFKLQASDMREIRKEKVKEMAAKASPKVTLITTFVVMPTAILLIGGLMIMNMFMGDNSILNIFDF